MSPKKPVIQQQTKTQKRSPKEVLSKKTFFIDSSVVNPRPLIHELKSLGGTIEEFFSKNCTTVITYAPDFLGSPPGNRVGTSGALKAATPAATNVNSPGNVLSPSPSAVLNAWSPTSAEECKPKLKSRADTILERAQLKINLHQAKGVGGTKAPNLLENARRLGLEIWYLPKVLSWIESFKARHGLKGRACRKSTRISKVHLTPEVTTRRKDHGQAESPSPDDAVVCLSGPYVKIEDSESRFRPIFEELPKPKRFPRLYLNGQFGVSPFYSPPVEFTSYAKPSSTVVAKGTLNNPIKNKLRRIIPEVKDNQSLKRRSKTQDRPEEQQEETAAVAAAAAKEEAAKKPKKKQRYCELCNKTYDKLMPHLDDETHRAKGKEAEIWAKLDESIYLVNKNNAAGDEAVERSV